MLNNCKLAALYILTFLYTILCCLFIIFPFGLLAGILRYISKLLFRFVDETLYFVEKSCNYTESKLGGN